MIMVYGDFRINTLIFGLKNHNFNGIKKEVKIVYSDCIFEDPIEIVSNAIQTNSHNGKLIIYVLDNCDQINKKQAQILTKLRDNLTGSKYVICGCLNPADLSEPFNFLKKIQLGERPDSNNSIKKYVYYLVNMEDRKNALELFKDSEYSLGFIITLASYNLDVFYEKENDKYKNNLTVLENTNKFLYKVDTEMLLSYLIFSFQTTFNKRVIRFPPKNEDRKVTHETPGNNAIKTHASQGSKRPTNKVDKPKKRGLLKI
jgi:hypothetical protein